MNLDKKVREVFGPLAVQKKLSRGELFQKIPRYVTEFLLAKYVDPDEPEPGLAKIKKLVEDHYPGYGQAQVIKHRLMSQGSYVLLDEIEVEVDLRAEVYWARIPTIGENKARIRREIPEKYPGLMAGGMWGMAQLRYTPEFELKGTTYPIEIVAFEPFQAKAVSLDPYLEARRQFSSEEWIDVMLRSVGYEPSALPNRRVKLLILARLLPLVEKNLNLIELGPRQTGKTFLLRNISPHVFIVSGGKATPANLFFNLATKKLGIIGSRKVVFFDEIAHTEFDDAATISIFKDYMESGQFSRGAKKFTSDASIVFAGNLDVYDNLPDPSYPHLFDVLPLELQDVAFLDRIHGFIPGWEIPKIRSGLLTDGYGLLSDYLADVFNHLRERTFQDAIRRLELNEAFTQRDERAVARMTSGFIKLLYPHGDFNDEELAEVASLAVELRQRVHNQLTIMAPGEFRPKRLAFGGMPNYKPADFEQLEKIQHHDDRANREDLVGEITGLVALVKKGKIVGGDVMLVEASAIPAKRGGLRVTGMHGMELSHSAETAYAYVRDNAGELGIPKELIQSKLVHVHLVKIARYREGPSAGLTFLLAIISALTGWPVRAGLAVTGEVSLHGKVIKVGGVPEKVMAAFRRGRKLIMLPKDNESDLKKVPQEVLDQVKIILVDNARDAMMAGLKMPAQNAS